MGDLFWGHCMSTENEDADHEWLVGNYCVSFIDLLGQRDALQGQGLLPPCKSEEERNKLNVILRNSIGVIIKLQGQAEDMLAAALIKPNPDSPFRAALSPEQHAIWDEMMLTRIKTQRWSDGLVSFVCLGDTDIKCKMIGVFNIFALAGALCFFGLASRSPVRGAIEVAWGVELHSRELYGAAVARAYELESEIAQYPRIVVGPETVKLLNAHASNKSEDVYSQIDRKIASLCLQMLARDVDGHWILHYLGDEFQFAITHDNHGKLYDLARKYVVGQLGEHQANQKTKLALRYSHLLQYFDEYKPSKPS